VFAGVLAASDETCFAWLRERAQRFRPTHVHLEQPFMFPAFERLAASVVPDARLIYSSQNIEPPLKRFVLDRSGTSGAYADQVVEWVEHMESEASRTATLVVCASPHERSHYERLGARHVVVCRNGASPMAEVGISGEGAEPIKALLTVGSGHPPNAEGFVETMLAPALFFLPPRPALVVAGGMVKGLAEHPAFRKYEAANCCRLVLRSSPSDDELATLKHRVHGFLLPITHGGGTNLKTAEALLSGKWVVATRTAMRGFEEFVRAPGVIVEDDPRAFRRSVRAVLARPPLALSAHDRGQRRGVEWRNALEPLRQWVVANAR
jgi:glycosyltransferase involved in cell wall biosynthesis